MPRRSTLSWTSDLNCVLLLLLLLLRLAHPLPGRPLSPLGFACDIKFWTRARWDKLLPKGWDSAAATRANREASAAAATAVVRCRSSFVTIMLFVCTLPLSRKLGHLREILWLGVAMCVTMVKLGSLQRDNADEAI